MSRALDAEAVLDRVSLAEKVVVNVGFATVGAEVSVALGDPYSGVAPDGEYRYRIVDGDRRASIRKSGTDWTKDNAYLVSDTAGVYADVAITF